LLKAKGAIIGPRQVWLRAHKLKWKLVHALYAGQRARSIGPPGPGQKPPFPLERARERANKYFAGDHLPAGLSLWSLQASISSDADFICPLEVVAGGLATVPGTAGRVCLLFRGDSISASTCLQDGVAVFTECPSKGEMIAKLRRIFTEL